MKRCTFRWTIIPILLLVLGFASEGFAQRRFEAEVGSGVAPLPYSRVGRSGWQFAKLPSSARMASLGGIATVLSKADANAALTNPATISDVTNISLSGSSMNWIADITYYSGAVVKNFDQWGVFGLSINTLDYGDMVRTENQELFGPDGETLGRTQPVIDDLGTFSGGDLAVGFNYGRRITDRLQIGGTVKYFQETLDDATTGNWAIDIGTYYHTGIKSLRLAMLGQNFGPDTEFTQYDEQIQIPPSQVRMPMVFKLGAAFDLVEQSEDQPHLLTVATEFTHPNDGDEKMHVGAEYGLRNLAYLRGGYRFNYDEEGLTAGGGLNLKRDQYGISVDYAYIEFGRLGSVHVVTVGFDFGN